MELDILLRGQSNAYLFVGDEFGGAAAAALVSEVQRLLGFDGGNDTIRLTADWYTPGSQTIYGGTAFIGDWVRRGGDGAWRPLSHEQDLLTYIAEHPRPQATETAVVWLHSEYDSLNGGLSQAEWESAVRADAGWVRAALGKDAAQAPYVFVSAIPFAGAYDQVTQSIRAGMEALSDDAGFHARVGARALDIDMSFKFPSEAGNTQAYGNAHMSRADTVQTAQRLARSVAEEWADHARPGSPVALAGGRLDDLGPEVTGARLAAADTLLVTVLQDQAAGFGALDPDAARGLGWSVRGASGAVAADRAEVVAADTLRLHFGAAVPADGVLYYGYGYGRLAGFNQPGEGNALTDQQGMPVWTPAQGVAISGLAPPAPVAPLQVTVGTGSDSLLLRISQDAWQGSAQYTVKVDGVQVGGVLTAQAAFGSGSDQVTVKGDWGLGGHQAEVTFLNDAYGGQGADRNLHVDGASYNGVAIAGAARDLWSSGTAAIGFTDTTALAGGAVVAAGTGTDTLVLRISQDAYQGAAQYTVSVDGVQVGGVLTAQAAHGSGVVDTVTLRGDWAAGGHTVSVNFLNDAYGGPGPGLDRNLYVEGATYDGAEVGGAARSLYSAGAMSFGVTDTTALAPVAGGKAVTLGAGPDALVLLVSQDAYQGNAQYTIAVDGVPVGGTQAAQGLHGVGQVDTVTVLGNWAPGGHRVAVTFLNDAWGGGSLDRNLYVDGASYNGTALPGAVQPLYSEGTVTVGFTDSSPIA